MDIIDARSGQLVELRKPVRVGPDTDDWYTIMSVSFRTPLTRTAHVVRHDGSRQQVVMPVKLFPRLTYGPSFPSSAMAACVYPS